MKNHARNPLLDFEGFQLFVENRRQKHILFSVALAELSTKMSNRYEPIKLMGSNDGDDNVSCVTTSSSWLTDTETLSKNERELLHLPILLGQLVNNGDFSQVHQFILKYFTEDCLFQSPTMDAPAYGIQHVISTAKGIMQNMPDFMVSATNIRLMKDEEVAGSTVPPRRCIVFDRHLIGMYCKQFNQSTP